jgi:hypothetical protein
MPRLTCLGLRRTWISRLAMIRIYPIPQEASRPSRVWNNFTACRLGLLILSPINVSAHACPLPVGPFRQGVFLYPQPFRREHVGCAVKIPKGGLPGRVCRRPATSPRAHPSSPILARIETLPGCSRIKSTADAASVTKPAACLVNQIVTDCPRFSDHAL